MLKGKTVLLVHANSPRKSFILKIMKELGVNIICLNREITDFAAPYVDDWILEDLNNEEACVKKVADYITNHPEQIIEGVLTFWDECILLTSRLVDHFGWPGIPYEISNKIKNKSSFRTVCQEKNLPGPQHILLIDEKDLDTADKKLRYPLIVKPIYGAASAFVRRVENKEELVKAFNTIKENIHEFWLAPEWQGFEILVEEYIVGDEVDLDILIQNGEIKYFSIIDNKKTNEPYFVETGWSAPSDLSLERQNNLRLMAEKTLFGLGVRDGCIHFEAKSNPDGTATPIEINLRMGGGEVFLYSKKVWGVDLVENATLICLDLPTNINKAKNPLVYLQSYRFLPTTSCKVGDIKVRPELYNHEYFVDLYFEKKPGEVFLAPPDGYDRSIGVLTVCGESTKIVENNLLEALNYITYQTDPL
jgi:carnosine synthase